MNSFANKFNDIVIYIDEMKSNYLYSIVFFFFFSATNLKSVVLQKIWIVSKLFIFREIKTSPLPPFQINAGYGNIKIGIDTKVLVRD